MNQGKSKKRNDPPTPEIQCKNKCNFRDPGRKTS